VSSLDDGITWHRDGLAISDPQPCKPTFGGTGYSSVVPAARGTPGFLAYGGCTAFRSLDVGGAAGTWTRWSNGSFSSPGVNGTTSPSCLSGVPRNACCPIVTFNAYLDAYVMVYTTWGLNNTLFITRSSDGLDWDPPQVLLKVRECAQQPPVVLVSVRACDKFFFFAIRDVVFDSRMLPQQIS
jgi:hypothetical protein